MPIQKTDWLQVPMANYAISIYIVDTNAHVSMHYSNIDKLVLVPE